MKDKAPSTADTNATLLYRIRYRYNNSGRECNKANYAYIQMLPRLMGNNEVLVTHPTPPYKHMRIRRYHGHCRIGLRIEIGDDIESIRSRLRPTARRTTRVAEHRPFPQHTSRYVEAVFFHSNALDNYA